MKTRPVKVFKKCTKCGEEKKIDEFYKSSSDMYSADERQPICKSCVLELYNQLKIKFADERKAIYLICQKLDAVFKSNYARAAIEDVGGKFSVPIQSYFAKINSAKSLSATTFENSDKEFEIAEVTDEDLSDLEYTITKDDILTWGKGYTAEEYQKLNELYREYCKEYGDDNLTTRKVYISLVKTEITRDKALEANDLTAYQKLTELVSKLMADANLKPRELKGEADKDDFSLGVFIDKWEHDAALPEIAEEYKDVDKITKYITRCFTKPIRKTLGLDSE